MSNPRLVRYGLAILVILVAGYLLGVAGLAACEPPPLAGDEYWTWKQRLWGAFDIVAGEQPRCFLRAKAGEWALRLSAWSGLAALLAALAALSWETAGHHLRRAYRRRRGGHVILAGEPGEMDTLAQAFGGVPAIYLVRNAELAATMARAHPFADVAVLSDRREARPSLDRLGGTTARFVAAVTDNDLANSELAEAALGEDGRGELLVRMELGSVRALKSDSLRLAAEDRKRGLMVVSLQQIQARQALQLAMPGRYIPIAAPRIHVAVCGTGPMMQDVAFLVARQGYGLERQSPILSVMRTGHRDFSAGALDRLVAADAVEIRAVNADGDNAADIDRTFASIALAEVSLSAVHCCGQHDGSALALALRLERVFVDLELPVPPIVVHGSGPDSAGDIGMVRVAKRPSLAEARAMAARIDARAMAFHAAYLDGQRKARGADFGSKPAECPWSVLPERFRDDNRNAADHIDYKLAKAGLISTRGAPGASLQPDDIELLAPLEHARWMAAKSLSGVRYGPVRNDRLMVHPDMKPFDELDEAIKRIDRDLIVEAGQQLSSGGEALLRLRGFGVLSSIGMSEALPLMRHLTETYPTVQPMVVVGLDTDEAVVAAEAALAAKLPVEALVSKAPDHVFDSSDMRRRAAAILRKAWRIRVVAHGTAADTVAQAYPVLVDAEGRVDGKGLA